MVQMTEFFFERGLGYIDKVLSEAEEYIRIVEFQFSNRLYLQRLLQKAEEGVSISIITLPIDSIRASNKDSEKKRNEIQEYYNNLQSKEKGKIYECLWEVGDPSLTTTSESGTLAEGGGEKWYSLHGKFIVTDKHALITSANLIEKQEYDVYLLYKEEEVIELLNSKFEKILTMFIQGEEIPGELIKCLPEKIQNEITKEYRKNHQLRVRNYPEELIPEKITIEKGLYITPFDGKARTILNSIIEEADKFVYLLSERLYDEELVSFIKHTKLNSNVKIKILTGHPRTVRQNVKKARSFFEELGAVNIQIRAMEDIHAKCWLTEKWLVVGSANLGKMNLGFRKGGGWRANTEIMMLENNPEIIGEAKRKIDEKFKSADTLSEVLATSNKAQSTAKEYFDLFDHYSRTEAKIMFGKLRLKFRLETEQKLIKVARYASLLAKRTEKRYIEEIDVVMGAILLILQNRSSTQKEIINAFEDIINEKLILKGLEKLTKKDLIITNNSVEFKINIDKLLTEKN